MKQVLLVLSIFFVTISFAQEKKEKEQLLVLKKANNYVYEGNDLVEDDNFVSGEMEYRKAISLNSNSVEGNYNLGNAYYDKGSYEEALYRHQQAANSSTSKAEKHKAFHNIGNILMQNKKCSEAVEAFKSALRNNPTDDETRYNLALAKECAKNEEQNKDQNEDDQNKDQNQDENKENQDQKEDKKDQEGDNKEENKDQDDQKENEGDDKKDEDGKPKDEKEDKGKEGDKKEDKKQAPPKPQQGKMSPQQIKNLLEAMNNQEQKVQEKMNAEKQKGVKVKTDKDW
ncbi:tetratricopeptide repeat protein [Seonamhaeicola maritimus]|uniref:Tetratricopeptide repeat protein n=1 Tax=Seonamhaeicola maritimus TaxID=2591822 RepID=A0A5C7GIF5_9FLAO|nr:tetratricopeptide repeat protein [Seonamhaeicola maritimus]TXG37332.1 tetratricopeptide repeat protein [Seonamhaeicola maritimus]